MARARWILLLFFIFALVRCGTVPRIVILQDPLSADEHLKLGLSYEAKGEFDLAISEYEAALKKGGPISVIEGYLGNVYYSKKDFPAAKRAYRKSLHESPHNAPLLNNLASLYLIEKGDLKEAEALARQAIEIDPARRAYYLDTLGSIYRERGEYDLALSAYQEAEGVASSDPLLLKEIDENKRRLLDLIEGQNGQNSGF